MQNLLTLSTYSDESIESIIHNAFKLKHYNLSLDNDRLKGKTLVLYFEKNSTRTRLSCTRAWSSMGGNVIDLSPHNKSHIGDKGETLYDSFRVISEMSDCIIARVNSHDTLREIQTAVNHSKKKPVVINGLCDMYHPLQILADILTIFEDRLLFRFDDEYRNFHDILPSLKTFLGHTTKVAWVGDANNVLYSLMQTLPRFGIHMSVCVPKAYKINQKIIDGIDEISLIDICDSPEKAIKDAHFVVTDTWISMGYNDDKKARLWNFIGYQINQELIENGKPADSWRFMHCLPRKKEEVSDYIFYSKRSLVFEEAENRMWTMVALFEYLFPVE